MLYYTEHILYPVLNTVAAWLINAEVSEEGIRFLLRCLNEGYRGWRWIVGKVELGLDAALQALRVVKEEVMSFCRKYRGLIKELTKYAVRASAREMIGKFVAKTITREGTKQVTKMVTKQGTKQAAKVATRQVTKVATRQVTKVATRQVTKVATRQVTQVATKQVAKVATKGVIKTAANPVGIASDIAQTGLEAAGYKELGKTVGITGNIASGAMLGGAVGGPAGAAVGALLGFGVWGVGEVTGRLVDRAFGE